MQQAVPAARAPGQLPAPDQLGDRQDRLLAVAENRPVQEFGDGLGVEGGVAARDHQRIPLAPPRRRERDAGQVERGEQVGVAEFGREAHAEHVERPHRPVPVHRELADAVLTQKVLQVRPDAVGALGEHAVAAVQHLVEDLDALVGDADLVGVRVHQRPPHVRRVPVLHHRVELAADVLDRLAHQREQRLQPGIDRFHRHPASLPAARRADTPPARPAGPRQQPATATLHGRPGPAATRHGGSSRISVMITSVLPQLR